MLKIAVAAAIPTARVRTQTTVKPGTRRSFRSEPRIRAKPFIMPPATYRGQGREQARQAPAKYITPWRGREGPGLAAGARKQQCHVSSILSTILLGEEDLTDLSLLFGGLEGLAPGSFVPKPYR
jgi:hypothetical protein